MIIGAGKEGTLDQVFFEFMCSRSDDALYDLLKRDEYHVNLLKKEEYLLNKIKELGFTELHFQIDGLIGGLLSVEKSYSYRQGFFDGLRISQMQDELIEHSDLVKENQKEMDKEDKVKLASELQNDFQEKTA